MNVETQLPQDFLNVYVGVHIILRDGCQKKKSHRKSFLPGKFGLYKKKSRSVVSLLSHRTFSLYIFLHGHTPFEGNDGYNDGLSVLFKSAFGLPNLPAT